MNFTTKEAENLYYELTKRYGYIHINASEPISVDALNDLEKFMISIKEKHSKKKDLDYYFNDIEW